MTTTEFNNILERLLNDTRQVLSGKAKEYAGPTDRLHNFKRAAELEHSTPERALRGMLTKHIISVYDLIDQLEDVHECAPLNLWHEKLGDIRNYCYLLEALIIERTTLDAEMAPD